MSQQQGQGEEGAPPPFWRNPAFCAMFCDPFIEGSPLQRSHVVLCLAALAEAGDDVIEGCITGRALYEGAFALSEALAAAKGGTPC